jgi:hypothetical protein
MNFNKWILLLYEFSCRAKSEWIFHPMLAIPQVLVFNTLVSNHVKEIKMTPTSEKFHGQKTFTPTPVKKRSPVPRILRSHRKPH